MLLDTFLINIFFITYDIRPLLIHKVWPWVNHLSCLHLNFTVCKREVIWKAFWGLTIWSNILSSLFQKLRSFRDITSVCIWCFWDLDLWAFTTQNLQVEDDDWSCLKIPTQFFIIFNLMFAVFKPPLKTFALLRLNLWVNLILWPGLFMSWIDSRKIGIHWTLTSSLKCVQPWKSGFRFLAESKLLQSFDVWVDAEVWALLAVLIFRLIFLINELYAVHFHIIFLQSS